MRVAVVQAHPRAGDIDANVATVGAVLELGARHALDLVVLPELFLQAYHIGPDRLRELAVEVPLDLRVAPAAHPLARIAALAAAHGVAVLIGFAEAAGTSVFNSVALLDADGSLVASYRKSHLWGDYERRAFMPGPGSGTSRPFVPAVLARYATLPIGLLICFDIEFPEPARLLALAGARVIIAVMASGERDAFTSRIVIPTRAAENGAALIFCNLPSSAPPDQRTHCGGPTASDGAIAVHYSGGSCVAMPDGSFAAALPPYACNAEGVPASGRSALHCDCPGYAAAATAELQAALETRGVLAAADDERVLVVDIDPLAQRFEEARLRNPYLRQRRADLFAGLDAAPARS